MNPDGPIEENEDIKTDSPRKNLRKKSPMEIKTEYLNKLFETNIIGSTVHNRNILKPYEGLTKKLSINHF